MPKPHIYVAAVVGWFKDIRYAGGGVNRPGCSRN